MLTHTAAADTSRAYRSFHSNRNSAGTASVAQLGIAMSFGRNAEIYAEGENSGYVYKVISGVIRVSKLLPDGRRQISAFHMPGEIFGLEADEIHHASAEAVIPTKVIAYKWEGVRVERQPANFVRELLNLTLLGLRHTQDHLLLLGRKNALERVAAFLLEMSARMDGARSSTLPCRDTTSPTISG
jgi:CRP-like cAMP-binding protein